MLEFLLWFVTLIYSAILGVVVAGGQDNGSNNLEATPWLLLGLLTIGGRYVFTSWMLFRMKAFKELIRQWDTRYCLVFLLLSASTCIMYVYLFYRATTLVIGTNDFIFLLVLLLFLILDCISSIWLLCESKSRGNESLINLFTVWVYITVFFIFVLAFVLDCTYREVIDNTWFSGALFGLAITVTLADLVFNRESFFRVSN